MSTGEVLRVRAAMKPISTVPRALRTVDVATGEAAVAINQRSDVCAVPAAGVVAEAMVALVLAEAALEKFGGDSLAETRRNAQSYLATLDEFLPAATMSPPRGHRRTTRRRQDDGRTAAGRSSRARFPSTPTRWLSAAAGKSVSDIFIEDGEERFRELERAAVVVLRSAAQDEVGARARRRGGPQSADPRRSGARARGGADRRPDPRRLPGRVWPATGRCSSKRPRARMSATLARAGAALRRGRRPHRRHLRQRTPDDVAEEVLAWLKQQ